MITCWHAAHLASQRAYRLTGVRLSETTRTLGGQVAAAIGKTRSPLRQWARSLRIHSRHRCIRQEIADQITPICMLHVSGDEDLAAVQNGGSVRVAPDEG
jgi:hypothetical protein